MKSIAISAGVKLVSVLFGTLKPDLLREVVDTVLDVVEKRVTDTPNKVDDVLVLPLCATIRNAFNIPDDDKDQSNPE
jgi:hypothetical protein